MGLWWFLDMETCILPKDNQKKSNVIINENKIKLQNLQQTIQASQWL